MSVRIITGDCREVLRTLPAESVHMIVTSPPYWGLRDYGTAKWEGGDPGCDHSGRKNHDHAGDVGDRDVSGNHFRNSSRYVNQGNATGRVCSCGARRIDSQIGLESSITDYVAVMVDVFREVRRVLRADGTLWLNLGDSYAGGGTIGRNDQGRRISDGEMRDGWKSTPNMGHRSAASGLKPKDLCGIPWRVAFALQADGWWLRSDIIWAKPNPMPESVTDRPTKAHEYLFLLSKSANYFYDAEAIKEEGSGKCPGNVNYKYDGIRGHETKQGILAQSNIPQMSRNRRTVWEIATSPFPQAHFATFPPALVEPCIKAGTSEKGVCGKCGAPWVRETERGEIISTGGSDTGMRAKNLAAIGPRGDIKVSDSYIAGKFEQREKITLGFSPSCSCKNADVVSATVLDPFGGAGTTGLVADRLGRNAVLIELNPEYAAMAHRRIVDDAPLLVVAAE